MALIFDSGDAVVGKGREALFNGLLLCAQGNGVMDGLAVSEKGAGANMSVDVAVGGWVAGSIADYATTVTNIIIEDGDANNRYDLIYAEDDGTIDVVKGTHSATNPQVPSVPADSIPLAIISVVANESTSIENTDITDVRCFLNDGRITYLISNDTEVSSSVDDTNLQSVVVTAAMASYPYLLVEACGDFASSVGVTTRTMDVIFHDGTSQVGNGATLGNSNNQNVDSVWGGWALKFKMIAGTHYTRGTGFTLSTRTANKNGSGGGYDCSIASAHLEVNGLIN